MVENSGDVRKPNGKNENKKKKSPYRFRSEKLFSDDEQYFQKLQDSYEKSKQAKRKVYPERQEIKNRLQKIKQQLKKSASEEDKALLTQDLAFFRRCLPGLNVIEGEIDKGLSAAKRILETGVKQPYALLVDFERVPCPSERALDKNRNKGNGADKKKSKGNNDKTSSEKDKSAKLNSAKLNEMRGIAKDTQPASRKNTNSGHSEEKINTEEQKSVSGVAAAQNTDVQNKDDVVASKGKRKTLADYKKEYGFTRAVQRKGKQHSVQNLNIWDKDRGR